MRASLLGLMFLPLVAFGQPFIGPEIVSAPINSRKPFPDIAAPAVALARDDRGIVIAWTAADETSSDRLFVARLDAEAQVTGAVHEMPTLSTEHVDVTAISITKSATLPGFVASWMEMGTSPPIAVFCRLTPDLSPA